MAPHHVGELLHGYARSGTSCWTWTPWPPPKARNGSSTAPRSSGPPPGEPYRLALLALSPDGGDANRYREFDVESRTFVDPADGGFDLPTAKGNVSWLDADTLLVASTADGLPMTASSYARTAVTLKRGDGPGRRAAAVRGARRTT